MAYSWKGQVALSGIRDSSVLNQEIEAAKFLADALRRAGNRNPIRHVELESTGIKVNLVSPGFTKTNLNGYEGTQSLEEGSREVVRVALLGPGGPTGTFTRWENATIPW